MTDRNSFAASVQAKKGRLYAVIQVKENGKSKAVWRALGLPEGSAKSKVQKAYREVVSKFEDEYAESLVRRENPAAGFSVFDYLCSYLNKAKSSIRINTYESYQGMIYGKIRRCFEPRTKLTVDNLQPKDIEDFYDSLFADGVTANTVIHYHAIMRRAFS
ncbi:N-terminal phage integrase SAM-like domain-containing protein [Acutalibacter sp. 1XD8-33]|uniref:N-terminal phage integrase SAM-like domain-containing protein n=1 Tax=Acutalibacter sp. 1XD8-33 TaxID=2320081 RepID=UPI001FA9EB80|nr:N-terminal phage integrase SAM-like domain-containing protein [Acutalibacter sp. 1XD8-33]